MTQPAVKPGQIWVEMDPRDERYVLVIDAWGGAGGWVRVRRVNADGSPWPKSRALNAAARRFNGKRGGYALHKESP